MLSTHLKRSVFALFFFSIFFIKMFISVAPIYVSFDKDALMQVVLQLEIENNNGKSSLSDSAKDCFAKDYPKQLTSFTLQPPSDFTVAADFVVDEVRHVRAFYPTVPTPPPNC